MRQEADHLDAYAFAALLGDGYQSNDLSKLSEVCAPGEVARYQREIDTLSSLGLVKRISARRRTNKEPVFVQTRDGKNEQSLTTGDLGWTEEFVTGDGRRVTRFRVRRALGELRVLRLGPQHTLRMPTQLTCGNCGSSVTLTGTQSVCPSCGAQFRHEALRWLVSSFRVTIDKSLRQAWTLLAALFVPALLAVGGLYLASFLGWVAAAPGSAQFDRLQEQVTLGLAFVVVPIWLLAFVWSLVSTIRAAIRRSAVRRRDPHFSKQALDLVVNRVLETNPQLLGDRAPGDVLLSGGVLASDLWSHRALDDREQITLRVRHYWYRCARDASGRVRVRREQRRQLLELERSWAVRTPVIYVPSQYTCARCGSRQSISGAFHQVCAFCGTRYRLPDLDWALVGSETAAGS